MTRQRICQILLDRGYIERVRVNRYRITLRGYSIATTVPSLSALYTRDQIMPFFAFGYDDSWTLTASVRTGVLLRPSPLRPVETPIPVAGPVLRTIRRDDYHWNGGGATRNGISEALAAIPTDEDGVKRSFGLEWEIYSLSPEQEDKLARLLDTLPPHFTERDGSLGSRGVEIIFLPLGEEKIKEVWHKLQEFCINEGVDMVNTGAHLTYGVSNTEILELSDLTIRLNRIALAVKAASPQRAIKEVFGRDFTSYAHLPNSSGNVLLQQEHSMAWSASRGTGAYELRLCHWKGNIEKIVKFMKVTEFVFHRAFTANDFINIFRVMGSNCAGE